MKVSVRSTPEAEKFITVYTAGIPTAAVNDCLGRC
jgi:hypothetical protein